MRGRVLVVAASDSGGGGGIQGDIKTITSFDAYAMTAVTALTAQDTHTVHAVYPVPPRFVRQQMECLLDDIGADAVKTGRLGDCETISVVCEVLWRKARGIPLVIDPVLASTSGRRLLTDDAVAAVKRSLLPLAHVLTPNIAEAQLLGGMTIDDEASMHAAAEALRTLGVPAVLLKGGRLPGRRCWTCSRPRPASRCSARPASGHATCTAPGARWRAGSRPGWRRGWRCATR